MPHDMLGQELKAGDTVVVEFVVREVSPGEDYCNVLLAAVEPMRPSEQTSIVWLNAKQVMKAVKVSEYATPMPFTPGTDTTAHPAVDDGEEDDTVLVG